MKVIISEACDGFTIVFKHEWPCKSFWFSQEDGLEGLVEVFEQLGIEAEYEEDY